MTDLFSLLLLVLSLLLIPLNNFLMRKAWMSKLDLVRKYESETTVRGIIKSKIDVVISPEEANAQGIEHDIDIEYKINKLKQYQLVKSTSSCWISEINIWISAATFLWNS